MGHHPEPKSHISPNLPESLRKSMETFQAKNTLPVFLKGGPFDRVLFTSTVVLCGVGLLGIAHMVYVMGFTKKSD